MDTIAAVSCCGEKETPHWLERTVTLLCCILETIKASSFTGCLCHTQT